MMIDKPFVFVPRCVAWDYFQRCLGRLREKFEGERLVVLEANGENLDRYPLEVAVLSYEGSRFYEREMVAQLDGEVDWKACRAVVVPVSNGDGSGFEELLRFADSRRRARSYMLTPGGYFKSLRQFWRGAERERAAELLAEHRAKMERFRDLHRGGRCFVIGNGPSLNKLDLTLLKDEVTFGVNAIYLNIDKMGFLPTYYAVEDVFVAEDRADEINALRGPTKFIPIDLRYCLEPAPGVVYVNFDRRMDRFPSYSFDCAKKVYWGSTVTYMNMQIAHYMGFCEVYLIGMDFSYSVPKYATEPNITSRGNDVNHFHPDYFGKGYRWHHPRLDRVSQAFELAGEVFERTGRRIFNATAGGKLELFPRRKYEEVLCRK